ncbi:MAG: small-conductance mechanosensitive channel [Flavobacteriaceae bacterium]|jgi:small-conductance mechanosensitive channel|uniref:mechanosensitive ion channel domain-containing protein n=1 Tax=Candidatus Marifrigoribacter sp. Uisw_064 TaxID=3230970 RepID=UPI003ADA2E69
MEEYQIQIIQTTVIIVSYIVINTVSQYIIKKVGVKFTYSKPRIKVIKKLIHLIYFVLIFNIILFIWGVDQSELMYFITSLLTVLGIAFFAQWSIISNITSSLIIFFNHPVNIGDTITIMDKDFNIEGQVSDVGIFFLSIRNNENEKITIPNNVFIQKMIKKKG